MDDREAQRDELEILESIYGDLISFESEDKIRISFDSDCIKSQASFSVEEEEAVNTSGESYILEGSSLKVDDVPTIYHGDVFTDRKSHFQAHLARVHSKEEVALVLDRLLENGKIARATHNMYAYRITELRDGREIRLHDCFDDGETGASSKMLELLHKMDANNVLVGTFMVVVSRWYGGIHLGPDRFRHINNLTREIISKHGLDSRTSTK
ncbi:unnamed protein product [Nippostrongylus brasiliensis]|uniref:Protein IMPACT homolog (inferred by orthology to a C. elegans protein) n=1 Tax=Nippostrongylus brasiliensis TaxID=27835 RepID=A0A0N4XYX7_NIPBR|nr:unnamed protein product [Nippostrongylus brasiliensis]